jgi:uncharacterized membrane protein YvbJ
MVEIGCLGFSIIFMIKIFKKKDIDWLILMDEDALFVNSNLIYPLIDYLKTNNDLISGVRMEVRFQSDQVILCYEFFLFGY